MQPVISTWNGEHRDVNGCRVGVREKYSGLIMRRNHEFFSAYNMMPDEARIFYGGKK